MIKNYEDEIIRKLGCFYIYKQQQKRLFFLDFSDVKDLDLLGMLILYKFLEYSVINKCFFNPCLLNFEENRIVASEGGAAAGEARAAVEKRTGRSVITNKNAAQLQDLVTGLIEADINETDDKEIR